MEKRYYIAYGSNLNVRQMLMRCPSARIIGTSEIHNYRFYHLKTAVAVERGPVAMSFKRRARF